MVLGYYKYRLKYFLVRAWRNFKLRGHHTIGPNCYIAKDTIINGKVTLRKNVELRKNVILHDGVTVSEGARLSNIEVKEHAHIEGGVICTGYGNGKIILGKESYIGVNNVLDWSDDISIGNYVHIAGPSTALWTHSSAKQAHAGLKLINKNPKYRPTGLIIINDNVYIGGNCTIYPGVKIGHHSIIAPNSAVNKNVEPYTLVAGVPAKKIKDIDYI
jgi:acetyltransferase-like isoleucine patch superfamily enzyme